MKNPIEAAEAKMNELLENRQSNIDHVKQSIDQAKAEIEKQTKAAADATAKEDPDAYTKAKDRKDHATTCVEMYEKRLEQLKKNHLCSPEETREVVGWIHAYLYEKEMELTGKVIDLVHQIGALRDECRPEFDHAFSVCVGWNQYISPYTRIINEKGDAVKADPVYKEHSIFDYVHTVVDYESFKQVCQEYQEYQQRKGGKA